MFVFTKGVPTILVLLVWLGVFVSLFVTNELGRRGFISQKYIHRRRDALVSGVLDISKNCGTIR